MDPRSNVRPGERLRIAASQVNFLNRLMAADTSFRSGPLDGWQFGGNVILARNDTGDAVPRWGVMKADGIVIDPNDGDGQRREFEAMPCVIGAVASSGETKALVAIEPIAADAIGKVAVSGVVQIKSADVAKVGGAIELWKDGDWSLIRLGGDPVHLCKTAGSFAKGTIADLNVWEHGTPPDETQNDPVLTLHNVVNKYANIAADKWVSVARHGNGYWYVISAECG